VLPARHHHGRVKLKKTYTKLTGHDGIILHSTGWNIKRLPPFFLKFLNFCFSVQRKLV
jgi:hypothetical protein